MKWIAEFYYYNGISLTYHKDFFSLFLSFELSFIGDGWICEKGHRVLALRVRFERYRR